ncbi:hypothetical protein RJ640_007717 [Escallonia rubra]|uniref:NB-ARC domain-containing protein n=1 Tax=Escallonia rubra TaxID=112253 RepID=A0AA88QU24_9ASTE|nr:hypothetical protein RJ640_007717 [Escallonia rubra]
MKSLSQNFIKFKQRRCLVIIDDIWQAEAWDELSPAFPCTMSGSKILLTTRNKEVALHVHQRCFVHELRQLSECERRELFETKAYLRNDAGFGAFISLFNLWSTPVLLLIQHRHAELGCKEDVNHPSFAVHGQEYFGQHSRLRSALFFGGEAIDWQYVEQKILKPIVMGFTFLRVLDLEGLYMYKFLILTSLNNLAEWNVDEGAMMSLLHLVIEDCKKLKRIPEGLRFISSFKELEIIRMPEAFRNRLRRGGEDFRKVQHVPSISTSAEFYAGDY